MTSFGCCCRCFCCFRANIAQIQCDFVLRAGSCKPARGCQSCIYMGSWGDWKECSCESSVLSASSCTSLHRKVSETSEVAFFVNFLYSGSISCGRDFAKQMMTSWGWEELVDDRGVKYYGNPQLKITQYEHPSLGIFGGQSAHNKAGSNVSRIELPKHPALALPYGWEMLKDASGYMYIPLSSYFCLYSFIVSSTHHDINLMRSNSYYGNPQLRITQYQHPSLGIISQNKTLHESSQISSVQTFNHSGTSSFSSIANAGGPSRETPLLDDPNDCIHTQANHQA